MLHPSASKRISAALLAQLTGFSSVNRNCRFIGEHIVVDAVGMDCLKKRIREHMSRLLKHEVVWDDVPAFEELEFPQQADDRIEQAGSEIDSF
jgi:hypothetical protein